MERVELFHDHFQNYKRYGIPKAQLVVADIPYNVGVNAYGSSPQWYINGDNKNGASNLAGTSFFDTDENFRISEFFHFCHRMLVKEPKERGKAPCMIVFCSFEQQFELIKKAAESGFPKYINLVFRKNFSPQVLKANMRVVGNCEYAIILFRDKLPKFNNEGQMVFNCMDWTRDNMTKKLHPCLPAGQKVFFNGKWIDVENAKIGDKNRYGSIVNISKHQASILYKIKADKNETAATWNHPFLIKRDNAVYWAYAEKIKPGDYILTSAFVYSILKPSRQKRPLWLSNMQKQKRGILDSAKTQMGNCVLNIVSSGKRIMGKFLLACKYTIRILTKKIIKLKICSLSLPLNTSGITLVADLSMGNGKSHARYAASIKNVIKKIGTILVGGLTGRFAKNALLKNQSKQERFLLQKVGSVLKVEKKQLVYNLTMSDIPAFDTLIGVSHNTQKPIPVLENLIRIFTDENDVVIDPVAGSGTTLLAARNLNRRAYGFEIKKNFYQDAKELIEHYSPVLF